MQAEQMKAERELEDYSTWLEREGLPVYKGYSVENVHELELAPWPRLGGKAAYVRLVGSEWLSGMYVCEIPPGQSLEPEVHLFEAVVYALKGRGRTEFWRTGEPKVELEWVADSMFALPLNVWHRFHNPGPEPARIMVVNNAPLVINLFGNTDFVFAERYAFTDRYHGQPDYFGGEPRSALARDGEVVYENNYIPNIKTMELGKPPRGASRGGDAFRRRYLRFAGNRMGTFANEFPPKSYTMAHWHGGGYHIYIAQGEGYTLMWPPQAGMRPWQEGNADKVVRVEHKVATVYSPPTGWWHQHFNTGDVPVRYVPAGPGFTPKSDSGTAVVLKSVREGGHQLDYDLEDPKIKELYEEALAKRATAR